MAASNKPADPPRAAKPPRLASVMREFDELVRAFDRSRGGGDPRPREAGRLAMAALRNRYTRKYISRSLHEAEAEARRVEELLHALALTTPPPPPLVDAAHDTLGSMLNGYFRLYSTELFDLLGQPTDLRFGSLRFHSHHPAPHLPAAPLAPHSPWVHVELALNDSFFVADSLETLPYHTFRLPTTPSLQNRGILSRRPEDHGSFPHFDSWLLFTFLGNGCIKLEVPIEMCADVYGDRLHGRENEEVVFWGLFVDDYQSC
ncbi:hypothetical protein BDU57DRAFT_508353 [Ampelomyces quisqualis]|uniref:Uncharacterized protein n=1 Tax=Ampelomyces quisqualis TaxID=50730 RepID=A0A6A5QZC2_AMPQU|nr:hypothetical protein BDU57DRAFT_508353 [Ampelomyces quisqualis]